MLSALGRFVMEGKFEAVSKGLAGRIERVVAVVLVLAPALFGIYVGVHWVIAHSRPQPTAITRQVGAMSELNAGLAELSQEKPGPAASTPAPLSQPGRRHAASNGEFNANQFRFLLAAIYDQLADTIPAAVLKAAGLPLTQSPLAVPVS